MVAPTTVPATATTTANLISTAVLRALPPVSVDITVKKSTKGKSGEGKKRFVKILEVNRQNRGVFNLGAFKNHTLNMIDCGRHGEGVTTTAMANDSSMSALLGSSRNINEAAGTAAAATDG